MFLVCNYEDDLIILLLHTAIIVGYNNIETCDVSIWNYIQHEMFLSSTVYFMTIFRNLLSAYGIAINNAKVFN